MSSSHPFLNKRARFLGLDRGKWIKSFFAVASGTAIFILLSIIGSLLKEGYDFIPTNQHRIEVQRLSGGEFANNLDKDVDSYEDNQRLFSRALDQQMVAFYLEQGGRRQAGFAAYNDLKNQIKKLRQQLTLSREASRDEQTQSLIAEIETKVASWLNKGQLEAAVADSNSAEIEFLESALTRFQGPRDEYTALTSTLEIEAGLHHITWIRDPEAIETIHHFSSQQAAETQANSSASSSSTEENNPLSDLAKIQSAARTQENANTTASANSNVDSEQGSLENTLPPGSYLHKQRLLVLNQTRDEILGKGYFHEDNISLWIWIGPEHNSLEEANSTSNETWSAWTWSHNPNTITSLTATGFKEIEQTNLGTELEKALTAWSISEAKKPLLLQGLEQDRAEAAAYTTTRFALNKTLTKELQEATILITQLHDLIKVDVIETYQAAKLISLAPEKLLALLEGTSSAIDNGDLETALDNAESATMTQLFPTAYKERVRIIYELLAGIEGSNAEELKAQLVQLGSVATQNDTEIHFSEEYLNKLDKTADKLTTNWHSSNAEKILSVANLYEYSVLQIQNLEPVLFADLPELSKRFNVLYQQEELQLLSSENSEIQTLATQFANSLKASYTEETHAQATQNAYNAALELTIALQDLPKEQQAGVDIKALIKQIAIITPLQKLDDNIAAKTQQEAFQNFPRVIEQLQASPASLEQWRHDKPVSTISSFFSFIGGKRWVTNNSPWFDFYGMLPLFSGSLLIAFIAIALCVPFAVGAAICVNQFSSKIELNIIKPAIEFIEALPSVVLGFFGIAILGSELQAFSETTWLSWMPGFPIENRLNAFVAGVLLALMAVPTVFTLVEDALNNVPKQLIEASESLGASRFQTVFRVLLPTSLSGIIAAVLLGFGRVIGETMVVLLVAGGSLELIKIGTGFDFLKLPFEPTHTMTGIIAQEIPEVSNGSEHWAALFMIGVILFFFSLLINAISRWVVGRFAPKL